MGTPGRAVSLSKLNDTAGWEKRRTKGEVAVKRMVMEMMELYVHRLRQRRPVYPKLAADMEEFARGFPYTPTPDQVRPLGSSTDLSVVGMHCKLIVNHNARVKRSARTRILVLHRVQRKDVHEEQHETANFQL